MKYKATELVMDSLKDNTALQVKIDETVASELENIVIDREELVVCLCETRHDVYDLMVNLSAV